MGGGQTGRGRTGIGGGRTRRGRRVDGERREGGWGEGRRERMGRNVGGGGVLAICSF